MRVAVTKHCPNEDVTVLTIGGKEYTIHPALFTGQELTKLLLAFIEEVIDDEYIKELAIQRIYLGRMMENIIR